MGLHGRKRATDTYKTPVAAEPPCTDDAHSPSHQIPENAPPVCAGTIGLTSLRPIQRSRRRRALLSRSVLVRDSL